MSVNLPSDNTIKAVISCSEMCRLLKMSRSQFYLHVKRGTFHPPLYLQINNRPYFTTEMAQENRHVRNTCIGINGSYVIFYERRVNPTSNNKPKKDRSKLVDGLKSLGVAVTIDQLESAIAECYPKGTEVDESDMIRVVFRHLKRSGIAL